jgi:hypothetical protein
LLYENPENRITVGIYTVAGNSFRADKPRLWSQGQVADLGSLPGFDLHPDGKRFVLVTAAENTKEAGPQKVTLILNFSEELRRRVPSGKK